MKTTQAQRDRWRKTITDMELSIPEQLALIDDADRCAKLESALTKACEALTKAKRLHEDGCGIFVHARCNCDDKGRCDCGATDHNTAIDTALIAAREALVQP